MADQERFTGPAGVWSDLPPGYGTKLTGQTRPERLPSFTKPAQPCEIRRVFLTANPYGGKGKGKEHLETVKKILEGAGVTVQGVLTERPGHNTELCRTLDVDNYDAVVIIGGDGSVHEAITGLMTRTDGRTLPLGIVPGGTGNSFLCDLSADGKLMSVEVAARAILDNLVASVDLAKVTFSSGETVYSCNIVDYPAEVLTTANKLRMLGNMMYKAAGLWHIVTGQYGTDVTLTVDGEKIDLDNVMVVHVQNNQHSGDQVCVAPYARLDDGLLDMMLIGSMSKASLIGVLADVNEGRWVWRPDITHRRFKHMSLEARGGRHRLVNVDGEVAGSDRFDVEVLPGALRLLVSRAAAPAQ